MKECLDVCYAFYAQYNSNWSSKRDDETGFDFSLQVFYELIHSVKESIQYDLDNYYHSQALNENEIEQHLNHYHHRNSLLTSTFHFASSSLNRDERLDERLDCLYKVRETLRKQYEKIQKKILFFERQKQAIDKISIENNFIEKFDSDQREDSS
jgi:hypothetical protein